jgi:hypothetical protein
MAHASEEYMKKNLLIACNNPADAKELKRLLSNRRD